MQLCGKRKERRIEQRKSDTSYHYM